MSSVQFSVDGYLDRVALRAVNVADAEWIYRLRTDAAISAHLSPVHGGVDLQVEWIEEYQKRNLERQEFYFVIQHGGDDVGVVRIYGIKQQEFTWGSWIILQSAPKSVAPLSTVRVYDFAFSLLQLGRAVFDVRNDNRRVAAFHRSYGAKLVAQDDRDSYFELSKIDYTKARRKLLEFARLLV